MRKNMVSGIRQCQGLNPCFGALIEFRQMSSELWDVSPVSHWGCVSFWWAQVGMKAARAGAGRVQNSYSVGSELHPMPSLFHVYLKWLYIFIQMCIGI